MLEKFYEIEERLEKGEISEEEAANEAFDLLTKEAYEIRYILDLLKERDKDLDRFLSDYEA